MAEDRQNGDGNGESIDTKAQGLVNAYAFLFSVTDARGRHIEEANIREVYNCIVHDPDRPVTVVMRDRQPHFTKETIDRICQEYGLKYDDRPRKVRPYGGAAQFSTSYPVHIFHSP